MKRLLGLVFVVLCCAGTVSASPVWSKFNPTIHGFRFSNTFSNDFVPVLDIRTGGLCGGMVYTALDYFNTGWEIPNQDYRPANGTALEQYLYNRQVDSIYGNVDKWAELGNNPFGWRNSEFFYWGLDSARIGALRKSIDGGMPVPLGLQGADGRSSNHQVLAVGYDLGRYQADLGSYQEDFVIYIYDPNYPNATKTLMPDLKAQVWVEGDEKGNVIEGKGWQSYFVASYNYATPPWLPNPGYPDDGKVYELIVKFQTGQDDLRSWTGEFVDLCMNCGTATEQWYGSLNANRWLPFYEETVRIVLSTPLYPNEIQNFTIQTNFGGFTPDNWDLQFVEIRGKGGGTLDLRRMAVGGPYRFTGSDHNLTISSINRAGTPAGMADTLQLWFTTGDDNLRGGGDNASIVVAFTDGRSNQVFNNINNNQEWGRNTVATVVLRLAAQVAPSAIASVTIQTNFGGGLGGENWDVNEVAIFAQGNGVDVQIGPNDNDYTHPVRFTGDFHSLTLWTYPRW